MKKTVSAAVAALMIAALLLSACGKKTRDYTIGTLAPESEASLPARSETVPESEGTDAVGAETDFSTGEAETEDDPEENDLEVGEDYVSSGTFKFKRTSSGQTWLDKYEGKDEIVVIPAEDPETGSPVTGIDVWAFRDNGTVRKIVVPDSVTEIGQSAFMYCVALEKIDLPESLKIIGSQAFYRCTALKNVSVPEGVETLGYATFMLCENLEEITLPKTLTGMEDSVFSHCGALLTINYRGSESDWGKVVVPDTAKPPTWFTVVYDYAG